jgi:hypothetical protein
MVGEEETLLKGVSMTQAEKPEKLDFGAWNIIGLIHVEIFKFSIKIHTFNHF